MIEYYDDNIDLWILIGNNNIDVGNYQILLDAIVNSKDKKSRGYLNNRKAGFRIDLVII